MPLARIITDSVDESLELTMQLRSRGFQVETVAPGDVPSTPADLEVRLEECNSEDVLTRTAQVSEADDLWVFVAPGALDDSVRPVRTIPLVAPVIRIPETKSRPKVAPSVVPFASPEDDLILLELPEFNLRDIAAMQEARPPNGNGTHGALVAALPAPMTPATSATPKNGTSPRAPEIPPHSAEVVRFPATAESQVRFRAVAEDVASTVSGQSREPAPIPAADLRFLRIASFAAALAIAALLLGVNLSRTPGPPMKAPQPASTVYATLQQPHRGAKAVATAGKRTVPAPPKPAAGKTNAATVSRPPIEFAAKATRLRKTESGPRARPSSDDVAKDTVVYFDHTGRPSTKRPMSDKRHSDAN